MLRHWPSAEPGRRGTILLVHGLGEHVARYGQHAAHLTARGWDVSGHDHRGHGRSGGPRGALRRADDLLFDLAAVVDHVRARAARTGAPLILLGQSMGGLLAAQFAARAVRPIEGLVLTSPALDAGLNLAQRLQLAVGRVLAPDVAQSNQLDPEFLSHDAAVVRGYRTDPLVHDRITARLAGAIVDGGAEVRARAATWTVPTLLMWAGADHLVSPSGSAEFAARAPASVVRSRCFDGLYHEILNEVDATPVLAELDEWLDARFPRG